MSTRSCPPTPVTVQFYDCDTPTRQELIESGHISRCEVTLLDWLDSLTVAREAWRPQSRLRAQITEQVAAAQANAIDQCLASRFAPEPTPTSGVAVRVASHLRDSGAGSAAIAGSSGMKALLPLRLSALNANGSGGTGNATACPPIAFHILHWPVEVGGNTYLQNTVMTAQGTPPTRTGSGELADTAVFSAADQTLPWSQVIYTLFTGGSYRISSSKVFNHWVSWDLIRQPAPTAELEARSDAFDLAGMSIDLPGFPPPGAQGPRWLVVHRYSHSPSGRSFWFAQSITPQGATGASWPVTADFGRGYSGSLPWSTFEAPDDGADFDPAGTWTRESGVVDFAMTGVAIDVRYDGELCAQATRTIGAMDLLTAGNAPFVADAAVVREIVEVRTIKAYKAAYRLVSIEPVRGIGILVRVRLINDFEFAATIVARMPLGRASQAGGLAMSGATITMVRSLAARTESSEITYIHPLSPVDSGVVRVGVADVMADLAGAMPPVPGFACAPGAIADGIYTQIASTAGALTVTTDGQLAELWGVYSSSGHRFWISSSAASGPPGEDVMTYSPLPSDPLPFAPLNLAVSGTVAGEIDTGTSGMTINVTRTGQSFNVGSNPAGQLVEQVDATVTLMVSGVASGTQSGTVQYIWTTTGVGVVFVFSNYYGSFGGMGNPNMFNTGVYDTQYAASGQVINTVVGTPWQTVFAAEIESHRWHPFSEPFTHSLWTSTTASARYGNPLTINPNGAYVYDATSLAFTAWSGPVRNGSTDELQQHLLDTHPYKSAANRRNVSFPAITKRPVLVVSRKAISDHDSAVPALTQAGQILISAPASAASVKVKVL